MVAELDSVEDVISSMTTVSDDELASTDPSMATSTDDVEPTSISV